MEGLCVDILWMVVWLSVRTVGAICKVEGDVQVVNNFHVCLYSYVKSMSLESSCYVNPYSFSLWSGCVFENGKTGEHYCKPHPCPILSTRFYRKKNRSSIRPICSIWRIEKFFGRCDK